MPALPAQCLIRSVNGLFAATLLGWVGLGLVLLTGPRMPVAALGSAALLLILLQAGLFLIARTQDAARCRVLQEQSAVDAAEQDRLQQRERLYRLLIESPHDLVVQVDREGRFLFVNPTYCTLFGKNEADLLGQRFMPLVHEEDRAATTEAMQALYAPPYACTLEQRALTCAGWRWLSWSDQALLDAQGQVVAIIGVGRDITAYKQIEEQLRISEARLNEAQRVAGLGSWELNLQDDTLHWSDEVFRIFERNPQQFTPSLANFLDAIYPEDRERVRHAYANSIMQRRPYEITHRLQMDDGRIKVVQERCETFYNAQGKALRSIGTVQDITLRTQIEERLRQAATVFASTREGILISDADNRIITVNPAFTTITGYSEAEVQGQNPRLFASGRHGHAFYAAMWASLNSTGYWQGELWNRRKNGEDYPEWLTISVVRDVTGKISHYIAVFADITQIKQSQERLDYMAHYDVLTGLPNRLLLWDRLEHAMQRAARNDRQVAVLCLDLDRFKDINEGLGHLVGDALLSRVAERLVGAVRRQDTVARLSGDEFVVILEGINSSDEAAHLAEKLARVLREPFSIEEHELSLGASIGISLYPHDGCGADALLKQADAAMYRAKAAGRGSYQFFSQDMTAQAFERVVMENQLRRALAQEELLLHYQPQLDLVTGAVVGLEALLRWQHPEQGLVPPGRFIPLAEETGLITPIGEWVLRTACAQAQDWRQAGLPFGRIAVNIAGPQLQREGLSNTVRAVLDETGLPPACLELEITETLVMRQVERTIDWLQALQALGVMLAIDDFGTGYSSLAYLKRLPVDKLKIDRSFVRDLPGDENDAAIARAVIALGHSMHLTVIAEGVETAVQRDFLRESGCDQAQGFLYSQPLPALEAEAFLRAAAVSRATVEAV